MYRTLRALHGSGIFILLLRFGSLVSCVTRVPFAGLAAAY